MDKGTEARISDFFYILFVFLAVIDKDREQDERTTKESGHSLS